MFNIQLSQPLTFRSLHMFYDIDDSAECFINTKFEKGKKYKRRTIKHGEAAVNAAFVENKPSSRGFPQTTDTALAFHIQNKMIAQDGVRLRRSKALSIQRKACRLVKFNTWLRARAKARRIRSGFDLRIQQIVRVVSWI